MDLFLEATGPEAGGRVLDLACGAGRHLRPLREVGYRAVGFDLSRSLLAKARGRRGSGTPLVRGDMRSLPFRDAAFDGVVVFFTSFGYFRDREDDARVLREMSRTLRAEGGFLLDYLNPAHVRENLVEEDVRELGGRTVRQSRWIEEGKVMKRIEIEAEEPGGEPRVYRERVRLYEPERLEELLRAVGLPPSRRFGDYDGAAFEEGSPRLILTGRGR